MRLPNLINPSPSELALAIHKLAGLLTYVSTGKFLGRSSAGAGEVEQITGTQTTAGLDVFTSTLKGLAPASGGGTDTFLRADATFAAPDVFTSALDGFVPASGGGTTNFLRADGSFAAPPSGIADDSVTFAKIQNISADKVLGRSSAGAGDAEEISCTAAGRALIDDADAAAQRNTLGLGLVENAPRSVLQCLQTTYTANTDLTTNLPGDDSVPQSSEGTQVLSQQITPGSSSNKILCLASVFGAGPGGLAAALFRGTTCIDARFGSASGDTVIVSTDMIRLDSPATASAVTYSVRAGAHSGTARLNGYASGRFFAGIATCTLTVMEIAG